MARVALQRTVSNHPKSPLIRSRYTLVKEDRKLPAFPYIICPEPPQKRDARLKSENGVILLFLLLSDAVKFQSRNCAINIFLRIKNSGGWEGEGLGVTLNNFC